MEETMSGAHDLTLLTYASFAAALLAGGYLYKELRDYRERRKTPKLNFPKSTAHEERDREDRLVVSR
jgi:hypothetical protein